MIELASENPEAMAFILSNSFSYNSGMVSGGAMTLISGVNSYDMAAM